MSYTFRGQALPPKSATTFVNLASKREITDLKKKGFVFLDVATTRGATGGPFVCGEPSVVQEFLTENKLVMPSGTVLAPASPAPKPRGKAGSGAQALLPPNLAQALPIQGLRPPSSPLPPRAGLVGLPPLLPSMGGALPGLPVPLPPSGLPMPIPLQGPPLPLMPGRAIPRGVGLPPALGGGLPGIGLPTGLPPPSGGLPLLPSGGLPGLPPPSRLPPTPAITLDALPPLPPLKEAEGGFCALGQAGSAVFVPTGAGIRDIPKDAFHNLCNFHIGGLEGEGYVVETLDGDTYRMTIEVPLQGLTVAQPQKRRGKKIEMQAAAFTRNVDATFYSLFDCRANGIDYAEIAHSKPGTYQGVIGKLLMAELFASLGGYVYYRTGHMDKYGRLLVELYADPEYKVSLNKRYLDYEWHGPEGFDFPEGQRVLVLSYDGGAKNEAYMEALPKYRKHDLDLFEEKLLAATKGQTLASFMKPQVKTRAGPTVEKGGLGSGAPEDVEPSGGVGLDIPDVPGAKPLGLPLPSDAGDVEEKGEEACELRKEGAKGFDPHLAAHKFTFHRVSRKPLAPALPGMRGPALLPTPTPQEEEDEEDEEDEAERILRGETSEGEEEEEEEE